MKVLLFAKKKPGLTTAIEYLKQKKFEVIEFIGSVGAPFPNDAYGKGPDIVISYMSPWIIPVEILKEAKLFSLNFHPGPPEYPGIGCTNFAIYNGEKEYGVTAHHMLEKVDRGNIVNVKRFAIKEDDSVYSLTQRCYDNILIQFIEVFNYFISKKELPETTEIWKRKPYTRKELNELCKVTCDMTKEEITRRIRATEYPGMPGAYVELNGFKFIYNDSDIK